MPFSQAIQPCFLYTLYKSFVVKNSLSDNKPSTGKYGPRITTNHALSDRSPPGLFIVLVVLIAALALYAFLT